MAEQIKTNRPYPIQLKLRDGRSAVIRVMEPRDLDKIVEFAKDLPGRRPPVPPHRYYRPQSGQELGR